MEFIFSCVFNFFELKVERKVLKDTAGGICVIELFASTQ